MQKHREGNLKRQGRGILSNVWYCVLQYRRLRGSSYFWISGIRIIFAAVTPFAAAVIPGFIVGILIREGGSSQALVKIGSAALGLALLTLINTQSNISCTAAQFFYRIRIGPERFSKNLKLPFAFAESSEGKLSHEKARMMDVSGNDTGCEAMLQQASLFITNLAGLLLYASAAAGLQPWLLLFLLLCPLPRMWLESANRKWKIRNKEHYANLQIKNRYLQKCCRDFDQAKDIRIYRIGKWFEKRFQSVFAETMRYHRRAQIKSFAAQAAGTCMTLIRDAACYGYLIFSLKNGMELDVFTMYLAVIAGFGNWINGILESWYSLAENSIHVSDYRIYMELPEGCGKAVDPLLSPAPAYAVSQAAGCPHSITLDHVTFSYPGAEKPVIDDLSVTLRAGEKTALVGENGAGKSTLVKLICGLYEPQKGRILFDGSDIGCWDRKEYFRQFAVVFQDVFAFAFSIEKNVCCCKEEEADQNRLLRALEQAGIGQKIRELPQGVKTRLGTEEAGGVNLSGGELQKLMLARALYKDAPILILDEPTAALDPISEKELYDKYQLNTEGKTSLFISHRLSSAGSCDRVLFFKDGKITEDGTHGELLLQNGDYSNMYRLQAQYYQREWNTDAG